MELKINIRDALYCKFSKVWLLNFMSLVVTSMSVCLILSKYLQLDSTKCNDTGGENFCISGLQPKIVLLHISVSYTLHIYILG